MNKKSNFPRLAKWMFFTGILFLLFMTAARFVFFYRFAPFDATLSGNLSPFLMGLHFDIRIISAILLFPFLAGSLQLHYHEQKKRLTAGSILTVCATVLVMGLLIFFMSKGRASRGMLITTGVICIFILIWLFISRNGNPFKNELSARVFKIYFLVVTTLLVLFYIVDFEHYDYLHERLNAGVLNYLGDPKISGQMVWQTYPAGRLVLLAIICTGLICYLVFRWYKKIKPTFFKGPRVARWSLNILFAFLLALGIFGRLGQYPLRWSDAFAFDNDFKASLALNPVQSFLSTFEFKDSRYDAEAVKKYYPLMAEYLQVDTPNEAQLSYRRHFADTANGIRPNIVLVICESFSAYKSSMWGNPLDATPFFNELSGQGIFFDRCFTPAYGTARGVWATLTGIPDVTYPNTASRNPGYVSQHTIINDYTGYDKFYFIGGSSSWANIRGLFTNNIDGLRIYEENDFKAKSVDVWGISDKRLFMEANDVFKAQQKPFFAVIQTADNHPPYTIPDEDRKEFGIQSYPADTLQKNGFESNGQFNAFRYADFCFRKFIEAAKKEAYFNHTIFVFVGDHGIRGNAGSLFPQAWEADGLTIHHVPLLFYSPALLAPQRRSATCSQADVLPSVTALAKIPYTNTAIGRNLFDTAHENHSRFRNVAFIFDPGKKQIGMVTDEYCYTNNLLGNTEDFRSSKDNIVLPQSNEIKEDRKLLKQLTLAYYETAKYMLANNKKTDNARPAK